LPKVDGVPYVFIGQDGTSPLQNLKRPWDRIRTKAGIPDVRFHDLRRTVGSWLAGSGESLSLIGKVLNHRDVSTTAIYARLNLDPVRRALEHQATKILAAAELQRTAVVRSRSKTRIRSIQNLPSHKMKLAGSEYGRDSFPVTVSD
jgi:integrase